MKAREKRRRRQARQARRYQEWLARGERARVSFDDLLAEMDRRSAAGWVWVDGVLTRITAP